MGNLISFGIVEKNLRGRERGRQGSFSKRKEGVVIVVVCVWVCVCECVGV